MKPICVADCETDPFEHGATIAPFIWGFYNGTDYREFDSTDDFVAHVRDIDCIVYAHNGGKFDWFFILDHLDTFSPVMVISGRLAKFTIGRAEFRDSYNILPTPLSAYKKDDIDYSKFLKAVRHKYMHEIRDYLRSDCLYLYQYVMEFINRYGMSLTFAGAAMKQWQKIENVKAPETSADFYATFEPYYYGGRVQAFHLGHIHTPFRVIDINSAYPFAMTHEHPYGETWEDGCKLNEGHVERQFITLRAPSKGAFPFRMPDGSLEFPDDGDTRIFHVTGWEFVAAKECGALPWYNVLRTLTLPRTIRFAGYIEHFSALKIACKLSGDAAGYQFAKFFLNGLYGKFAANPDEYSEFMVVEPLHIHGAMNDGWDFHAQLGPHALMARDLPESRRRFYNLAVGASITGFVRAHLYRAMRRCQGVLYCDTDSIACADSGDLPLDDSQLGSWSREFDGVRGGIAGKKLYAFQSSDGRWKTASKGARLTPDELMQVAAGTIVEYKPQAPTFSMFSGIRYTNRDIKRKDVQAPTKLAKSRKKADSVVVRTHYGYIEE